MSKMEKIHRLNNMIFYELILSFYYFLSKYFQKSILYNIIIIVKISRIK